MSPDPASLYAEHEPRAIGIALSTQVELSEEDKMQEAMIALWTSAQRWTGERAQRGAGAFWPYACMRVRGAIIDAARIMVHGGIGEIRRMKNGQPRRVHYRLDYDGDDASRCESWQEPSWVPFDSLAADDEARGMIEHAPGRIQTMLRLRLSGDTMSAIGKKLGMSESNVLITLRGYGKHMAEWRRARGLPERSAS